MHPPTLNSEEPVMIHNWTSIAALRYQKIATTLRRRHPTLP